MNILKIVLTVEIITEVCDKFQKPEFLRVYFLTQLTIYYVSYCIILKNPKGCIFSLSLGAEGRTGTSGVCPKVELL